MAENVFIPDPACASIWALTSTPDENCAEIGDLSEVTYLLIADSATLQTQASILAALPDWTDPVDWAAFIDNADITGTKAKKFWLVGSVETGDPIARPIAGHKTAYGEAISTFTGSIKNFTQDDYDFFNDLRTGGSLPYIWLVTKGGYMFGSPYGIELRDKRLPFTLPSGTEAYEEINMTFTWSSKSAPLRIPTPVPVS